MKKLSKYQKNKRALLQARVTAEKYRKMLIEHGHTELRNLTDELYDCYFAPIERELVPPDSFKYRMEPTVDGYLVVPVWNPEESHDYTNQSKEVIDVSELQGEKE